MPKEVISQKICVHDTKKRREKGLREWIVRVLKINVVGDRS